MYSILNGILRLFGHRIDCGEMLLVINGNKEIQVSLGFTPKSVYLNLRATHCIPVCQGNVDSFDVRIVPDGFVMVVNLNSEFREIEWVAIK